MRVDTLPYERSVAEAHANHLVERSGNALLSPCTSFASSDASLTPLSVLNSCFNDVDWLRAESA